MSKIEKGAVIGAILCSSLAAPAMAQDALEPLLARLLARHGVATRQVAMPVVAPGTTTKAPPAPAATASVSLQQPVGLIVRMNAASARSGRAPELDGADPVRYHRQAGNGSHVLRFTAATGRAEARLMADRLRRMAGVASVDLDVRLKTSMTPNDAYFVAQHTLATPVNYAGAVDAVRAWNVTTGSSSTVIAFVDTGLTDHAEFEGRVLPGYDFVTDERRASDGSGRDNDARDTGNFVTAAEAQATGCQEASSNWHGTHMAGIAAARGNNARGIAGLNWNAKVLPVRAVGKCGAALSDVVDAMLWAAGLPVPGVPLNKNPAQVINLSLSAPAADGCPAVLQSAIHRVRARGALVVAATGNDHGDAARYVPSACAGVVAVTAVDVFGELARYGNAGATGHVTLAAPGGDQASGRGGAVLSTGNAGTTTPGADSLQYRQGTSVAAAHVTGIASLALGVLPQASPQEMAALLKLTSHAFPANTSCAQKQPLCGAGIANAANLVNAAVQLKPYAVVMEARQVDTDRYFRGSGTELASFEDGSQGHWRDSGDAFVAWRDGSSGAVPVCRFYHAGVQAHYYTADAGECERLKAGGGWTFQNVPFHAQPASRGICPQGTVAVQRFSREVATGVRSFRYSARVNAATTSQWALDGVAFCALDV